MRVLVTGASGFLGSALVAALADRGHVVAGTTTGGGPVQRAQRVHRHRLCDSPDPSWLAGIDVLIHAAWDLRSRHDNNVAAAERWVALAREHRVRPVFISSYSAYRDFPTAYGRDKAAAEPFFDGPDGAVVRPALIAGPGGIFERMRRTVERNRLIPLPVGGRCEMEVVGLADTIAAVARVVESGMTGGFNLSAGRIRLDEAVRAMARAAGRPPPVILPLPLAPLVLLTRIAGALGCACGLRDNLLGLRENARRVRFSHLDALLSGKPLSPDAAIATALPGAMSPARMP